MVDLDVTSLDFGTLLRDSEKGCVLKPILHNYLHNAAWKKSFTVTFDAGSDVRHPDGWFHPSTHPLWPARALYHYVVNPTGLTPRPMTYANTLSVMMGKAMHEFVQHLLGPDEAGYLLPKPTDGTGCWCSHPKCNEWGFRDAEVAERGHVDGVGELPGVVDRELFEFKTATELSGKVRKAEDMDPDWLRESFPDYWAQQQRYQRMSGFRRTRVLFFTLGFPWQMKEFVIEHDAHFNHQVTEKYRMVRQAVADQRPPAECCALKDCASRRLCFQ